MKDEELQASIEGVRLRDLVDFYCHPHPPDSVLVSFSMDELHITVAQGQ
jgi:hypothetical protein